MNIGEQIWMIRIQLYNHNKTRRGKTIPDSKVYEVNMGPIWDRQDSGGPHVALMNFAIGDVHISNHIYISYECMLP